uniref:Uncharacterized protein n=1 Tax=Glossina pallidipes TaxID=7398 RepID=A0A1B0AGH7_GLOPL
MHIILNWIEKCMGFGCLLTKLLITFIKINVIAKICYQNLLDNENNNGSNRWCLTCNRNIGFVAVMSVFQYLELVKVTVMFMFWTDLAISGCVYHWYLYRNLLNIVAARSAGSWSMDADKLSGK